MSGWRNFGIELTPEVRAKLVALVLRDKKKLESGRVDGYYIACLPGYGDPPGKPEPRARRSLGRTSARGYYITANDTTDTGEGLIRFERGGKLVDITDLVVDEEPPSYRELEHYQMSAPGYWEVYKLLGDERFPVLDPFI